MARVGTQLPRSIARDEVILSLLPLVNRLAKFLAGKTGYEVSDALGDGYLGAIYAVDHFDANRGAKLSTYAVPIISGYIMHGIRKRDSWPDRARTLLRKVDRALATLDAELGRPAKEREIEARFPGYRSALARARQWSLASLDQIEESSAGIADRSDEVGTHLEEEEQRDEVRTLLEDLTPSEHRAIVQHYFADKPLRTIARENGVSYQAVQQAHLRGLQRLRTLMEARCA